ncbi:transporter [Pseudoalteromonas shioyasakiensis]|uniref:LysE family transporter n=1 Tax=Pseudoalteromonas shioyasakiensis TaxID=1190813 RepID=A0ABT6U6G8_9GAMM|nr:MULTISPECIES: LysE family transporter [Pseudoalteromonas]MCO6356150.1 transporter [Pseudoalteromonas shioyasakiensis]MDI4670688.1 LysE family transporter [Pseudoalteromonas shioyasakiensis]MDI4675311.1 LysE family transporter [Pseudoalteromonas shioyasakiensis]MDI4687593.1 LysE family transporter [Pseudoalteromonas shioyasakiensis]MDI4706192.1 LysE family transporter [Pseudoalteromonas shioyasakiensis]|tara:strand:- start:474 stop:1076 length:603 start_codon:yes stop_codon:yes gene_type:complete
MADIFAYAIGIMYTPGPINLLGLSSGLNKQTRSHLGFFIGVGSAMFILFVLLGYLGLQVINPQFLPYVSLIGCGYILYIAWKVAKAKVQVNDASADASLSFFDGLFMQLLNPKALVATLPIATIQFPSADITGAAIVFWSLILAILAFGAPTSYSLAGLVLGKQVSRTGVFNVFNKLMAVLLVYVALMIAYEHVLTPLMA